MRSDLNKKLTLTLMLLILTASIPLQVANAATLTPTQTPQTSKRVSVGGSFSLEFGADFADLTKSTVIILMDYDTSAMTSTEAHITVDDTDVTDQFDFTATDTGFVGNCSGILPPNGAFHGKIVFQAGSSEGNYTIDWDIVYIGEYSGPPEQPPPIPLNARSTGQTNVEIIYGVDVCFYAGWNLFGAPLNMREESIPGIFGDNTDHVQYIYGYNNMAKTWRSWINGFPEDFQQLKKLEGACGYWLYASQDFNHTILISGLTPTGGSPLDGKTVYIGYISSATVGLETAVPLIQEMIEPDLNAYAQMLGYDIQFEFLIEDAASQAAVHLEKVQEFHAMGVDLIIGGGWSSQAQASLSYVNDNNMLLFSSSSTSPLLAISEDNLYRMCPDDTIQAPAISRMIQSMGVKYVVVIQRGDVWADGIWNLFQPHFEAHGGVILERIRYTGEATEFADYLQQAEDALTPYVTQYGADKCGVEIISFQEAVTMVTQAEDFPVIYGLKWFGSDGTSLTQQFLDDAPTQSTHLHIYSPLAAPVESTKFNDLYDRYWALVDQPFGYYSACTYDIAWVIAKAVLEAQSTDPSAVIPLIKPITYDYFGASGWCKLNEAGDRAGSNYQIWGYGDIGSGVQNVVYGLYDAITDSVTWNTEYLGFTPTPR